MVSQGSLAGAFLCKSFEEVSKSATDEVCQHLAAEAFSCFEKLNFGLAVVQSMVRDNARDGKIQSHVQQVLSSYQIGAENLGVYQNHLNKAGKVGHCLTQQAEVEEVIKEVKKDISELKKLQNKMRTTASAFSSNRR